MKDTKKTCYKVTFDKKPKYNATWILELGESGAFKYGNGTCVIVTVNGQHHELIDTRYDNGVIKNFVAWCDDYMSRQFNSDYGPHIERLADRKEEQDDTDK